MSEHIHVHTLTIPLDLVVSKVRPTQLFLGYFILIWVRYQNLHIQPRSDSTHTIIFVTPWWRVELIDLVCLCVDVIFLQALKMALALSSGLGDPMFDPSVSETVSKMQR